MPQRIPVAFNKGGTAGNKPVPFGTGFSDQGVS